jgi:DNA mismatch repair protein MutS2
VGSRFRAGDRVQTSLGKGVVREGGNSGRLIVEIRGRSVVLEERAVAWLDTPKHPSGKEKGVPAPESATHSARRPAADVDLHGLTVEEALARAEQALNDALLADCSELRLIHGKSSGRIRASLHNRLRAIPTVRAFCLDPRNPGVTVVSL